MIIENSMIAPNKKLINFFGIHDLDDVILISMNEWKDMKSFMPGIKRVVFNDPATIVWFDDGTKVIVKKSKLDKYSKEHALLYAIVKRIYGKIEANGEVSSNGFMNYINKVVENGYDQKKPVSPKTKNSKVKTSSKKKSK